MSTCAGPNLFPTSNAIEQHIQGVRSIRLQDQELRDCATHINPLTSNLWCIKRGSPTHGQEGDFLCNAERGTRKPQLREYYAIQNLKFLGSSTVTQGSVGFPKVSPYQKQTQSKTNLQKDKNQTLTQPTRIHRF